MSTADEPLDVSLPPLADDGEAFDEPVAIAPLVGHASLDDSLFEDDLDAVDGGDEGASWLGELGGVDVGGDDPAREEAESGYLDDAPADVPFDLPGDEPALGVADGGAEGLDEGPRGRATDDDAAGLPPLTRGGSDDVGVDASAPV